MEVGHLMGTTLQRNLPYDHPHVRVGKQFGGGNLWTPTSLDAWWDAHYESLISASGGAVNTWNDRSGNGRALVASGGLEPTTGTRKINGKNAIDFDGTEYMSTPSGFFDPQSDFALFCVFLDDTASAGAKGVMIQNQDGGGTGRALFARSADDDLTTDLGNTESIFTSQPSVASIAAMTADWGGSTSLLGLYLDGLSLSGPTVSTEANASSAIRVGANKSGAEIFNGLIGEIILLSDITTETRQKIEGYLAWKWRLEAKLPASHPYKAYPPTL